MLRFSSILPCLVVLAASAAALAAPAVPPSPGTWHVLAPQRSAPLLYRPSGIAVGGGSVWVSDIAYGTVSRLSASGVLLRGWGTPHQFAHPTGVAVASGQGIVYVAERDTRRIHILSLRGAPLARTGVVGTSGSFWRDIVLATGPSGNVIAVSGGLTLDVERVAPNGRRLAQWTARLHHRIDLSYSGPLGPNPLNFSGLRPLGVAVARTGEIDLYFQALAFGGGRDEVSRSWYFMQRLSANGAFRGEFQIDRDSPDNGIPAAGLAITPAGDLLVPDPVSSRILRLSPANRRYWITPRTSCGTFAPAGMSVDHRGRILLANWKDATVQVLSASGVQRALWGGCPTTPFHYPFGVAVDAKENVYVADTGNNKIEKLAPDGHMLLSWPVNGLPVAAPGGIAGGRDGNIYVANAAGATVDVYAPDGRRLARWGEKGTAPGQFDAPLSIAVAPTGEVYIADSDNNRVQKLSAAGAVLAVWGGPEQRGAGAAQFNTPGGVAVGADGAVYIADSGNGRIVVRSPAGQILRSFAVPFPSGSALPWPQYVAIAPDGSIYVVASGDHLLKLSPTGSLLAAWGGTGTAPGEFQGLVGIALDGTGNLFAADSRNERIQKLDLST